MAKNINKKILRHMGRHPNVFWRQSTSFFRSPLRKVLREIFRDELTTAEIHQNQSAINLRFSQETEQHFQKHGWAFVENFIPNQDYKEVLSSWPSTRWFDPLTFKTTSKTYDTAFKFYTEKDSYVQVTGGVKRVYEIFSSKKFEDALSGLCNDSRRRKCYYLTVNRAYWGTGLAPHKDTPDVDSAGVDSRVNFIYFVKAKGDSWDAGGTSILRTNDFTDPIFKPQNLNNTLLIYRTGDDFFHGFPCMKFGSNRHAVTAHFREY